MISATVALAVVLASIVAARSVLGRRDRTGDRLKLGSVSQQWLLVHKGEDR
jgi:hypothetical protein